VIATLIHAELRSAVACFRLERGHTAQTSLLRMLPVSLQEIDLPTVAVAFVSLDRSGLGLGRMRGHIIARRLCLFAGSSDFCFGLSCCERKCIVQFNNQIVTL
jgi:hypothetical protein